MPIDLEQSLEQIEKIYWGEASYGSYLDTTCHQLRAKPLKDFTIEDLRIMIGQNISLDILMPLAFERLKQNILAEGDFYPGDLLRAVLTSDPSYWVKNPVLHRRIIRLYKNNLPSMEKRPARSPKKGPLKKMTETFEAFRMIIPGE